MSLTDSIIEANYWFSLYNRNYTKTCNHVNISYLTLKRYISLGEDLEFSILDELNKKGKGKLTIKCALELIKNYNNPYHQLEIYNQIKGLSNKDRTITIKNGTECPICYNVSCSQMRFGCCNVFVCIDCIYDYYESVVKDIVFKGFRCLNCNTQLHRKDIISLFKKPKLDNTWMLKQDKFNKNRILYRNMFSFFMYFIRKIERIQKRRINRNTLDFEGLISNDPPLYYGVCSYCSPPIDNLTVNNYRRIKVKPIEQQCVNEEGNIANLHKIMFKCEECTVRDNVEVTFKKCPHCGIKTIKPLECNYIICGDHRWCFICNERLPLSHEGHNVHYWMGNGTSAFSNSCRRSSNYPEEDYVLRTCDCIHCRKRNGAPLCMDIDCFKSCDVSEDGIHFNKYCSNHILEDID